MLRNIASENYAMNYFTNVTIRYLSSIAIMGFLAFLIIVILLHFLNPEFDPLKRFISEYITGHFGWLLNVAFVGNFIGCIALTIVVYQAYQPPYRSLIGIICFIITPLTVLTNFFPADLQGEDISKAAQNNLPLLIHLIGGSTGVFTMLVGMLAISIKLKVLGLLKGFYNNLILIAILAPIFFLAQIFTFDNIFGLAGLGQRIFVAGLFSWLIIILTGIRSGAITPEKQNKLNMANNKIASDSTRCVCGR
jgi:hypothetical protein